MLERIIYKFILTFFINNKLINNIKIDFNNVVVYTSVFLIHNLEIICEILIKTTDIRVKIMYIISPLLLCIKKKKDKLIFQNSKVLADH